MQYPTMVSGAAFDLSVNRLSGMYPAPRDTYLFSLPFGHQTWLAGEFPFSSGISVASRVSGRWMVLSPWLLL